MESTSMSMKGGIRTGAAIATALFAAGNLAGQRPAAASTRPRDSIVVRVFGPGLASVDSLRVLMQEFDREQAGTQRWLILKERIDSLFSAPGAIVSAKALRGMFAGAEANRLMGEDRRGWLGFNAQGPNLRALVNGELYITQLAHPVIVSVDPQSPADKAGIEAGDVLVAYNGVDVVNHEFNVTALLKPEAKVNVTIRRDGETKDFSLVVAKAPQRVSQLRIALENVPAAGGFGPMDAPEGMRRIPPRAFVTMPREGTPPADIAMSKTPILMITSNGVFGASVSTVNAELAKALNLRAGVLVNDVPEDTPAWRAGLRIGDIITAVQDQPVVSLAELREVLVRVRARAVALQVASRNQKTRTVTVSLAPSP
jgi:hypothetical protein